nr:hypothetical protein [uncultured Flavobacterium sp.]
MIKTSLNSLHITQDTTMPELTDVSSFSVTNYGEKDMYLMVNGVERLVAGFDHTIYAVPIGCFSMDGDGTFSDIKLEFRFPGGGDGNAVLDYRKLKEQQNNPICTV